MLVTVNLYFYALSTRVGVYSFCPVCLFVKTILTIPKKEDLNLELLKVDVIFKVKGQTRGNVVFHKHRKNPSNNSFSTIDL